MGEPDLPHPGILVDIPRISSFNVSGSSAVPLTVFVTPVNVVSKFIAESTDFIATFSVAPPIAVKAGAIFSALSIAPFALMMKQNCIKCKLFYKCSNESLTYI